VHNLAKSKVAAVNLSSSAWTGTTYYGWNTLR
jgi:hypothetical protein